VFAGCAWPFRLLGYWLRLDWTQHAIPPSITYLTKRSFDETGEKLSKTDLKTSKILIQ